MVPVACVGKVPNVVKTVIRNQVKKEVTDTPVWLDFEDRMKETFGLSAGEPNIAVIDAEGRLRFKVTGKLDDKSFSRLKEVITLLREEAAGVR
jgi:predicted transcriptional regulator